MPLTQDAADSRLNCWFVALVDVLSRGYLERCRAWFRAALLAGSVANEQKLVREGQQQIQLARVPVLPGSQA